MFGLTVKFVAAALLACGTVGSALAQAPAPAPRPLDQAFPASVGDVPTQALTVNGAIYVPAYSSVSIVQGKVRADFSVTLSMHNASQAKPLVLKRIAYFDTSGQLVQEYLTKPIALKPFGAIEIFISQNDVRGGTGANFLVEWGAVGAIAEPVVEALMVGGIGAGHYAFISQGRPVRMVGN